MEKCSDLRESLPSRGDLVLLVNDDREKPKPPILAVFESLVELSGRWPKGQRIFLYQGEESSYYCLIDVSKAFYVNDLYSDVEGQSRLLEIKSQLISYSADRVYTGLDSIYHVLNQDKLFLGFLLSLEESLTSRVDTLVRLARKIVKRDVKKF